MRHFSQAPNWFRTGSHVCRVSVYRFGVILIAVTPACHTHVARLQGTHSGERRARDAAQFPLELRQGREDPEDQLAARGCGVDVGALAGQDLEADAARGKVLGGIDEVLKMRAYPMRIGCPLYGRL